MVVHWISPYRTDRNIGKAINEAIQQLQPADDDWIVHTDHDVLFLLPDSKADIIERLETQAEYDILGAGTNRLSLKHQVFPGMFEVFDISDHVNKAKELQELHKGKVRPTNDGIAAMCMCFRYSLWKKVGGFKENRINFDTLFCHFAQKEGAKMGVMLGVYVFHLYRWGAEYPGREISHLR